MSFPSFSAGEVLTAADMNAVGLWKIAEGTLSGTATNFANVFSSTYDNYVITLSAVSFSGAGDLYWQWLTNTTPLTVGAYNWAYTAHTVSNAGNSSGTSGQTFGYTGISNSAPVAGARVASGTYTIFGPMNSTYERQIVMGQAFSFRGDWVVTNIAGAYNANVAPRNGIRFLTSSASTMNGIVRIYGQRL